MLANPNQVLRILKEAASMPKVPIVLLGFSILPLISSPGCRYQPLMCLQSVMMHEDLHPSNQELLQKFSTMNLERSAEITLCRYRVLLFSFLDIHAFFRVMVDKQGRLATSTHQKGNGHYLSFRNFRFRLSESVAKSCCVHESCAAEIGTSPLKTSWCQSHPNPGISASRSRRKGPKRT